MTKRFRAEPYLERAPALVTHVDGPWITLDNPILFAFSGGQQSDRGTVSGHDILASEALDDGAIRYQLPDDHGLAVGQEVLQEIDWELRFKIMRVHTATHMAYAAMSEQMGVAHDLIGSNVHSGKGRIDWALDETVSPMVPAAKERVQQLIDADLDVKRFADPDDPERWIWALEGEGMDPVYWRMPCGGTHVGRTGEIGKVKLKRKNIGKGKERVEVSLLD
jgi:Ser-tRNA(Ala) deacylase AlaX